MPAERNPPPQVAVVSYPTQNIGDRILRDTWDCEQASYKALEYGSAHPNTRDYADFKLVFQRPFNSPTDQKWVLRIWVNDRLNQDAYNYGVSYLEDDKDHPVYVRTYIALRSDYTPLAMLLADPVFSAAFLTKQQLEPSTGDPDLDSLYCKVTREYTTLPGPWVFDSLRFAPGMEVDPQTGSFLIRKKRVNIAENIHPSLDYVSGSGAALTAVLTGSTVASATISSAGSGYAEFVGLVFSAPTSGKTASGYATATAGVITGVVITDPGSGYGSAPTIAVSAQTIVSVERKDLNVSTAHEVVIFTTLPGKLLTTKSVGIPLLTPPKFRKFVTTTETHQPVPPDTALGSLTGDQVERVVAQVAADKTEQKISSRTVDTNAAALAGSIRTENAVAATAESLIVEGAATADTDWKTLKDDIEPVGDGTATRNKVTVNSFPTTHGQEYDAQIDVVLPYAVDIAADNTDIGTARKEITPLDFSRARVRTVGVNTTALDAYVISYPATTSLHLPDVLVSVSVVWESNIGIGTGSSTTDATQSGSNFSLAWGSRNSSQGSATIMPALIVNIKSTWASDVPVSRHLFFLPNPITVANVLARLEKVLGATINPWPVFKPQSHTIVLTGQKKSVFSTAELNKSIHVGNGSIDGYSETTGGNIANDVGSMIRNERIPPCIHGVITFSGDTTKTAVTTATSGVTGLSNPSGNVTASGGVTPSSLTAVSGVTAIPTSGLYLKEVQCDPYKWGYSRVFCEVFDFVNLA